MKGPDDALLVCVADDLTGAAAAAALLREAGLAQVRLVLEWPGPEAPQGASALVINADTRSLPENKARSRLTAIVREVSEATSRSILWNKRIDTTLRGHIAAEIGAMLTSLPLLRLVILAPAFPSAGRTTSGGVQLLRGAPIIPDGRAAGSAHLDRLLRRAGIGRISRLTTREIHHLDGVVHDLKRSPEPAGLILDADSQEDLRRAAGRLWELWDRETLIVDAGALAAEVARARLLGQGYPLAADVEGPVLVVVGTAAPATRAQVAMLAASAGERCVVMTAGGGPPEVSDAAHADIIVVQTDSRLDAGRRMAALADSVRAVLDVVRPCAVLLTGGLTASEILHATGVRSVDMVGELLPLLPAGVVRGGAIDGALVATKGGLVGGEEALMVAVRLLRLLARWHRWTRDPSLR